MVGGLRIRGRRSDHAGHERADLRPVPERDDEPREPLAQLPGGPPARIAGITAAGSTGNSIAATNSRCLVPK